jgi:hypothetical protein
VTKEEELAAKSAWDKQSVWSQTANNLKAGPTSLRKLRLTLTVAAAGLALLGSQLKNVSAAAAVALAIAAAVALAAVAATRWKATPEEAKHWTQARSVSEALKAEVFLFLCSGGDYRSGNRVQRLRNKVRELEGAAAGLSQYKLGIKPKARDLPEVTDIQSYLAIRVRKQQLADYYVKNAVEIKGKIRRYKGLEIALSLIAAGLATATAVSQSDTATDIAAWAAVITTAGGAVAAYVAAERYEFLWIEYSRTADQLQRLLDMHDEGDPAAPAGPDLSAECERVISIQNEAWMAKWGEADDSATAADDSGGSSS